MALPTGLGWPDVAEYKQWARLDPVDDAAGTGPVRGAGSHCSRCPTLATAACPHDAHYATML
jgi:hypothetical protein